MVERSLSTRHRAGSGAAVPTPEARIQSVGRAKALLDAMAEGDWVALRELSLRTGLAKTTAFNLVSALADAGLVEHDPANGAYRLGLQHLIYGKSVERRLDPTALVQPVLIRLCAETRETVNLALPCPTDVLIVDSLEGSQSLRVTSYAGTRASYHSTACGRALLAHQPQPFRNAIYDLGPLAAATPLTATEPKAIETILARCRSIGWTAEHEENEMGSACVAAPVFGPHGTVIAAVSIAGPAARFSPEVAARLGSLLVERLAAIKTGPAPRTSPGRQSGKAGAFR
jgi:IclR family acetate operon transcriptional repressor